MGRDIRRGRNPCAEYLHATASIRGRPESANDIVHSVTSSAIRSTCWTASERPDTPLCLTINGKAELIVQDAKAYQALLDRVEAIEGIQRGLADVKAGRTKPAPQVFARLRRKHGKPR
jgi:hypothetical protein